MKFFTLFYLWCLALIPSLTSSAISVYSDLCSWPSVWKLLSSTGTCFSSSTCCFSAFWPVRCAVSTDALPVGPSSSQQVSPSTHTDKDGDVERLPSGGWDLWCEVCENVHGWVWTARDRKLYAVDSAPGPPPALCLHTAALTDAWTHEATERKICR